MSGTASDLNSSAGRQPLPMQKSAAPGEADIFHVLYPDGHIPVEHLGRVSEMRSYILALLALASGQPQSKVLRKSLGLKESQAVNQQIARLRDTPKEDGTTRTWDEIALIVGWGITENACRKRYRTWKHLQRQENLAGQSSASNEASPFPDETLRNVTDHEPAEVHASSAEQVQQPAEQAEQLNGVVQQKIAAVSGQADLQEARPRPSEKLQGLDDKKHQKPAKVPHKKKHRGSIQKAHAKGVSFPEVQAAVGIENGRQTQGSKPAHGAKATKKQAAQQIADLPSAPAGGDGPSSAGSAPQDGRPAAVRSAAEAEAHPKIEPVPASTPSTREPDAPSKKLHVAEPKAPENSRKVSSTAAAAVRAPKIPHSEDEFIFNERAGGKKFREIHEALQARGIECKLDDVISRHYNLLKKPPEKPVAESKAPQVQQSQDEPTPSTPPIQPPGPKISPEDLKRILDLSEMEWSAEEISQELSQSGVSVTPERVAEILAGRKKEKKPEPKHFRRGELDAVIWKMHTKEHLSPEEISARLQEDGYSYEAGTIRTRLRAQGAKL